MNFLLSPVFWQLTGWLVLLIVGGLFIVSSLRHQLSRWQQLGLVLSLVGLLVFKRVLVLTFNHELNPDESQLLTQAITLYYHPVYWQSADGATMGPLSSYFISLPAHLGLRLDYIVLRAMAFLCTLVSIIGGYFALENFFGAHTARLALLPSVAFLAFAHHPDFLHATNEQLSLALLSLAFWLYASLWRSQAFNSPGKLFLLSFISSLVVFAKLQAVPTSVVIVGAAFAHVLQQRHQMESRQFRRALVGLLTGGLVFPLFVLLLTEVLGVFDDFLHFFLLYNLSYGTGRSFWVYLSHFPTFIYKTTDFLVFLVPTFYLVLGWLAFSRRLNPKNDIWIFTLATLAASGYAIIKPGNEFTHYLLYLLFPVCLLNALFINNLEAKVHKLAWVLVVVGTITMKETVLSGDLSKEPWNNSYRLQPFSYVSFYLTPVAQEIRKYARPDEYMVVWGWACQFNVQTQMPQGVCDNYSIRCIFGTPTERAVHRKRYIQNIKTTKPPIFLDAVGPVSLWLNNRKAYGYETFPELKAFINTNYQYAGEYNQTRLYVRSDRYKLAKPLVAAAR